MSQPDATAHSTWPRAIIWDLDGTLIDSAPDLATALNTVLNEQGQNSLTIPQVRTMVGGGVAKLIERAFRGSRVELDAEGVEALVPGFMEIYTNCATDKTALLPAAGLVLNYFHNAGVKQGLCTNKPEGVTKKILHALNIHGFLSSVIGGDSTAQKKPHPLPLQIVMEQLGVTPHECIMVGDSGADVGAARAAGIPVILVPDGYISVPAGSLGADFVLKDLSALPVEINRFRPVQKIA
jgi:phosphoglycolate phosphatase